MSGVHLVALLLTLVAGNATAGERVTAAEGDESLQPPTLSLLLGDNLHAWKSLLQAWPELGSHAERRAWQGMQAVLNKLHCGKDFPLTLPDEVSKLTLQLIQRDAPLVRNYRVILEGEGPITAAELIDSSGYNWLEGAQWELEGKSGVRVVGSTVQAALPAGLYELRLEVAAKSWRATVPLPALQDLEWLSRSPLKVAKTPDHPASCDPLWLEQTVLSPSDYSLLWWHRLPLEGELNWPASLLYGWQTLTLVQSDQRGELTLQRRHTQAGPIEQ